MKAPFGFPETFWTNVVEAACVLPEAREQLVGLYRQPVKAYFRYLLRGRQNADTDAEDLTQDFFCREWAKLNDDSAEGGVVRRADRTKGRFRDFLMASLRNFWHEQHRRARDGDMVYPDDADELDRLMTGHVDEAEKEFQLSMVRELATAVLLEVEAISVAKQQQMHYRLFHEHYIGDESWEAIAQRWELKDGKTARNMAETVARRFKNTCCEKLGLALPGGDAPGEIHEMLIELEKFHGSTSKIDDQSRLLP